jgi:uncharacterized integral membrane protein
MRRIFVIVWFGDETTTLLPKASRTARNERLTRSRAPCNISWQPKTAGVVMGLRGLGDNAKLIGIGIAVLMGFIFILQNFEQTSFQFLIWTLFSAPKWIVVSGTFALGLAFGFLLGKKKSF